MWKFIGAPLRLKGEGQVGPKEVQLLDCCDWDVPSAAISNLKGLGCCANLQNTTDHLSEKSGTKVYTGNGAGHAQVTLQDEPREGCVLAEVGACGCGGGARGAAEDAWRGQRHKGRRRRRRAFAHPCAAVNGPKWPTCDFRRQRGAIGEGAHDIKWHPTHRPGHRPAETGGGAGRRPGRP